MDTLVAIDNPIADALDRVVDLFDRELASDLPFVNRLTDRVRRYRGKLLRPRLLLLSGRACGELRQEHFVLAAVVEMVHMATLVHDDVLDEADVRRHSRTVNRMAGNQAAVMLGDYLISHAYHLCSSLDSTFASRRIAAATNTVCEGELAQIENRGNFELTEAEYLEIIRRKTAALTGVCCELAAVFAEADAGLVRHMTAFGTELGIAFQIVDDLLDVTATQREMGKTVGRDADLGKLTLPTIRYLATAESRRREEMLRVLRATDDVSDDVRGLLMESDAVDYTMQVASKHVRSALSHLDHAQAGDARDALASAAEFVLNRRQ